MERPRVLPESVAESTDFLMSELHRRIEQKGDSAYASPHEIFGLLAEEMYELQMAVHKNEDIGPELADIGVIVLWGLASLRTERM